MHSLLRPKFFIPVHGEYHHLMRHAQLAQDLGMKPYETLIPEIGTCVELTADTMRRGEDFPAGARLIDGSGFEDLGKSEVMKDRLRMSAEGLFIVSATISKGMPLYAPVIESRGFVFADEKEERATLSDLSEAAERAIAGVPHSATEGDYENAVRRAVKNYLFKKTKQSPMIVAIIRIL